MIINGMYTDAKLFAYDGCHKIYLIEDNKDELEAIENGYAILGIASLIRVWNKSCPLRFINNWKLDKTFVSQCEKAVFEEDK